MQNSFDVQQQILQKRLLQAQQMRDQEFAPPQEQIVGGRYIKPDFGNALVQSLRAYNGMQESNKTEKELADLQTQRTEGNNKALADYLRLSKVQPGDEPLPEGQAGPVRPAQGPDMQGAYAALMQNPDTNQMGMQGAMSMAENQAKQMQAQQAQQRMMMALQSAKTPQEALASGVPSDVVKNYYESGNWGKEKGVAINGQLVNPLNGEAIGGPVAKQADALNPAKDKLIPDGKGGWIPNPAMVEYEKITAPLKAPKISVEMNNGQKGFENETTLSKGFKSEPIYKDYNDMRAAYGQVKASLAQNTPIGDVAGATKMMKLLDPGSVVRESELGIAMAAAGKVDRIQNYFDMWKSGKKLTPEQRTEFSALSDELYNVAGQVYNQTRSQYADQGARYKLDTRILGPEHAMPKQAATANDKRPSLDSFKR